MTIKVTMLGEEYEKVGGTHDTDIDRSGFYYQANDIIVETKGVSVVTEVYYEIHHGSFDISDYQIMRLDSVNPENYIPGVYRPVKNESETENKSENADKVNSPPHYTQGSIETIDFIEQVTEGYASSKRAYAIGNVIKYLSRAPYKQNEEEDLNKALWYLKRAIASGNNDTEEEWSG